MGLERSISNKILARVPKEIIVLIHRFHKLNLDLLVVGGFLRNVIMDTEIKDLDLTTPAKPEELIEIFRSWSIPVIQTGIKYGTVTIILRGQSYEITTYRSESGYDGRRPTGVRFVGDWQQDATRRDFTFNAIFWSPIRGLLWLNGGLQDAVNRKIRFVGDYNDRVREDRIRSWRYLRFNVLYTYRDWSWAKKKLVKWGGRKLSSERIYGETIQIFNRVNWDEHHYKTIGDIPDSLSSIWFGTRINKSLLRVQRELESLIRLMQDRDRLMTRLILTFGSRFLWRYLNITGNSLNWVRKELKTRTPKVPLDYVRQYWRLAFLNNGRMSGILLQILLQLKDRSENPVLKRCLRLHVVLNHRYDKLTYHLSMYSKEQILELKRKVESGTRNVYPVLRNE